MTNQVVEVQLYTFSIFHSVHASGQSQVTANFLWGRNYRSCRRGGWLELWLDVDMVTPKKMMGGPASAKNQTVIFYITVSPCYCRYPESEKFQCFSSRWHIRAQILQWT